MSASNVQFPSLSNLNAEAIACRLCPRLRNYCNEISRTKRRQFRDWDYWGKPLPGFGDPNARLLILGLAPAAHGGNRTGRMFTGDGSAQFLMAALHNSHFANQPTSEKVTDGLVLTDAYMTAIVRCAPPKNKPNRKEIDTCKKYWTQELRLLKNVQVVLTLGRVAFDTYVRYLKERNLDTKSLKFRHGAFYRPAEHFPALCASYHPSRQNTQTGVLTMKMLDRVFSMISNFLNSSTSNIL
ncbi:MAG TPA: uracil-DNA glycosylase [Methylomirabilota bacterium]|nr:uracil-DNA glycosylase [Methylomirabilota bacterium]